MWTSVATAAGLDQLSPKTRAMPFSDPQPPAGPDEWVAHACPLSWITIEQKGRPAQLLDLDLALIFAVPVMDVLGVNLEQDHAGRLDAIREPALEVIDPVRRELALVANEAGVA